MTTDAKHVENLAGLSEVKSTTSELPTAAENFMHRRSMGVVSCLGSRQPADCQSYKAENCTDVTVSVHKGAHASGELVQSPGGDLHGPGVSPSHDEQVQSAD